MCQKRFLNIMDPKLNRISPVLYKSTDRSQNKISRPLFWSTTPSDRQKWFSLGEEARKQSEAARTASIGQPHRYLSGKQDTSSDLRDRNTVVLIGKQTEEPKFAAVDRDAIKGYVCGKISRSIPLSPSITRSSALCSWILAWFVSIVAKLSFNGNRFEFQAWRFVEQLRPRIASLKSKRRSTRWKTGTIDYTCLRSITTILGPKETLPFKIFRFDQNILRIRSGSSVYLLIEGNDVYRGKS